MGSQPLPPINCTPPCSDFYSVYWSEPYNCGTSNPPKINGSYTCEQWCTTVMGGIFCVQACEDTGGGNYMWTCCCKWF